MPRNEDALKFIFGRRSIRVFRPGEVSEATLKTLLEAAMAAPSAAGKDPWRFIAVRDRAMLSRIAEVLPNGKFIHEASLGVVVCGDLEAAHDRQLSYLLQDCSAAIENLLLAAHILGLGACWLGVHPREERVAKMSQLFSLPPSVIPVSAVAIGWANEDKAPRTRFNTACVYRETWQG